MTDVPSHLSSEGGEDALEGREARGEAELLEVAPDAAELAGGDVADRGCGWQGEFQHLECRKLGENIVTHQRRPARPRKGRRRRGRKRRRGRTSWRDGLVGRTRSAKARRSDKGHGDLKCESSDLHCKDGYVGH